MKKISKLWIAVGIIVLIALITWLLSGNKKKEEVTFETVAAAPATISNSITATGTIEPVTEVTVGTQVSGIVSKLYVDYNSIVKKGQVIAELDKTNLISQLNTAKANLQSAESNLRYQTANYKRYKALYDKGLVKDKTCFYYQIILSDYKDKFVGGTYTLNTAMTPTEMMKVLSCADTGEDK